MEYFLNKCADFIIENLNEEIHEIAVISPNRRSHLFLKQHIAQKLSKPAIMPAFFSIDDFMYHLSDLNKAEFPELLFELYNIHREIEKENAQSFERFLNWGSILINDISEIDENLVDAQELFFYLNEIKALSVWNLNQRPLTENEKNFIAFFNSLAGYYKFYNKKLLQNKRTHKGLAYRRASEMISGNAVDLKWKKILFLGFNALSASERQLIKTLIHQGIADILWDTDNYYIGTQENALQQEAGKFLRKEIKAVNSSDFRWKFNNLKNDKKNIKIIGTSNNISQVKIAGKILKDINQKDPGLNNTALILADESLLIPQLNSLPKEVKDFNVTMGYPLKHSNLIALFTKIIELRLKPFQQPDIYSDSLNRIKIYDLIDLISHPSFNKISGNNNRALYTNELIKELLRLNKTFCEHEEIISRLNKHFNEVVLQILFRDAEKISDIFLLLKSLINYMTENTFVETGKLDKEFLFHYNILLNQFEKYLIKFKTDITPDSFLILYKTLINKTSVSFYGEPLKGLQLMGMLESRTLDFKNLIIVSVNENILPSGSKTNSLIPFDVKSHYKLPTQYDRDALFAYHFYRLIQRSANIYLLYNTETGNFGGGESSRFIKQIRHELQRYNPAISIESLTEKKELPKNFEKKPYSVKKIPVIVRKLEKIAERGLSATSIDTYRLCPFKFFLREVAEIKENEELTEFIDSKTLGTILHETLKECFFEYRGKPLTVKGLKNTLKNIEAITKKSYISNLAGSNIEYGKNNLIFNVSKKLISNFLLNQISFIEKEEENNNYHTIIELEKRYAITIKTNSEHPVKLKGIIDRIDQTGNKIRIIDYKTGYVKNEELNIKEWEDLFHKQKMSKAFQLLFYHEIYSVSTGKKDKITELGIYSLRRNSGELIKLKLPEKAVIGPDETNKFREVLHKIISDIFDPDIEFSRTEDPEICKFCDYKQICNKF